MSATKQKSPTLAQLVKSKKDNKNAESISTVGNKNNSNSNSNSNSNTNSPSRTRSQSAISTSSHISDHLSSYIRNISDDSLSEENIRVICRFRPVNNKELHEEKTQRLQDLPIQYSKNNDCVIIPREQYKNDLQFQLDKILKPETTQEEAFEILAQPLVEQVMTGYNCTIFAYGQTGSGKTFTMFGIEDKLHELNELGIIPRSVDYLFDLLNSSKDIINFRVSVSIIEVYKEIYRDLLDNSNNKKHKKSKNKSSLSKFETNNINDNNTTKSKRLEVYTSGKETMIKNLIESQCNSVDDVLKCIIHAQNNRKVRKHEFIGHHSSRSHCVVTINVLQRLLDDTLKQSKLNFGDLAGSELATQTGAAGEMLKEAGKIHQGLLALENVISALIEKRNHVPYADSKLTRVLTDSLGGNSKTTLVVTCSPSIWNRASTVSTLRFAARARSIKNRAKINRSETREQLEERILKLEEKNLQLQTELDNTTKILLTKQKTGEIHKSPKNELPEIQRIEVPVEIEVEKLVFDVEKEREWQNKYDILLRENERLKKLVNSKDEQLSQYIEDLKNKDETIEELSNTIEKLNNQLNENNILMSNLRDEIADYKEKIKLLNEQLINSKKIENRMDEQQQKLTKLFNNAVNEQESNVATALTAMQSMMAQMQIQMEQMNNKQDTIINNLDELETGVTNNITNIQNNLGVIAANTDKLHDKQEEQLLHQKESVDKIRKQSAMLNELDLAEVIAVIPKIEDYLANARPPRQSVITDNNNNNNNQNKTKNSVSPQPQRKSKLQILNDTDDLTRNSKENTPKLNTKPQTINAIKAAKANINNHNNDKNNDLLNIEDRLDSPISDLSNDISNPTEIEIHNAEDEDKAELTFMDSDDETIGVADTNKENTKNKKSNNNNETMNNSNNNKKQFDDLAFDDSINYDPFPPPTPTPSFLLNNNKSNSKSSISSQDLNDELKSSNEEHPLSRVPKSPLHDLSHNINNNGHERHANTQNSFESSKISMSHENTLGNNTNNDGGKSHGAFQVGKKLDVLDGSYYWYSATVRDIDPFKKKAILVKYDQFDERWNEWISFRETYRLALHGTRSTVRVNIPNKNKNSDNKKKGGNIIKEILGKSKNNDDMDTTVLTPPNGVHVLAATNYGKSLKGGIIRERLVYADPNNMTNLGLSDVQILMCGSIYKRGRRWNKDYKERWFVLRNNMVLYYYENKYSKQSQYNGNIPLSSIREIRRTYDIENEKTIKKLKNNVMGLSHNTNNNNTPYNNTSGLKHNYNGSANNSTNNNNAQNIAKLAFLQFTFDIECVNRIYHLACKNNDELTDWMSVLQGLIHCPLDVHNPVGFNGSGNSGRKYSLSGAMSSMTSVVSSAIDAAYSHGHTKLQQSKSNNNSNSNIGKSYNANMNSGRSNVYGGSSDSIITGKNNGSSAHGSGGSIGDNDDNDSHADFFDNNSDKIGIFGAKRGKKTYDITNGKAKVDGHVEWMDRSPSM